MSGPLPPAGPNSIYKDLPYAVILTTAFASPFLLRSGHPTATAFKDTVRGLAWLALSIAGASGVVVLGVGGILIGEKVWDRLKKWAGVKGAGAEAGRP